LQPSPNLSAILLFLYFLTLLYLIAYAGAIVRAARLSQWVWFTVMLLFLLFAPFALLGYALFAPTDPQGQL